MFDNLVKWYIQFIINTITVEALKNTSLTVHVTVVCAFLFDANCAICLTYGEEMINIILYFWQIAFP